MKYMVCITESNLNLGLYIFLEYGTFDLNVFLPKDDKSPRPLFLGKQVKNLFLT